MDRYLYAWNSGDVTGLENIGSNQFEMRVSPNFDARRILDSLKSSIAYWHTGYSGFHLDFHDVVYAGNAVAIRWTMRGTNRGADASPETGKTIDVPGMSILHIADGKFTGEWISGDDLTWFKQLGYTLVATSSGR